MYERYTRQALPSKQYRELLGSAICIFNSNNAFIIENILLNDDSNLYDWYCLTDLTSGKLKEPIENTITKVAGSEIVHLFNQLINDRNRIIHSFQITDKDGQQRLATKDKNNNQWVITEDFLLNFIRDNEILSSLLHEFRGY
jgi:uncharacterized protein (DUF927 family)